MAINPIAPGKPGVPADHSAQAVTKPGNPANKTAQAVTKPGNPTNKTAQAVTKPGNPANHTAATVTKPGNPTTKTAQAVTKPAAPSTLSAAAAGVFPRTLVPALSLDFEDGVYMLNGVAKALSDFLTYTRASSGSFNSRRRKSDGSYEYFIDHQFVGTATNLALYSEDFSNAAWVKTTSGTATAPVVTQNAALAPDGISMTAARVQFAISADNSSHRSILRQAISTSTEINVSIWLKSNTSLPQFIQFYVNGNTLQTVLVTSEWQRFDAYAGASAGTTQNGIELRGGQGTGVVAADILVWGGQVTTSIKALPYVKTISATAAKVVAESPRFEYDPATGLALGPLAETAATNLILQSETFDNASWTKTNAAITANVSWPLAPDGTYTAEKLVPNNAAALGGAFVLQTITKAASALTYTASFYLKQGEFNRVLVFCNGTSASDSIQALFDLTTGTLSGSIVAAGTFSTTGSRAEVKKMANGWFRCCLTFVTNTDTSLSMRAYARDSVATTGDGASGVFMWGAQLEQSEYASSYIPTTTAAVTRAKDVLKMSGAGILASESMTVLVKGRFKNTAFQSSSSRYMLSAASVSGLLRFLDAGTYAYVHGSSGLKTANNPAVDDFKFAGRFDFLTNLLDLFTNGVKQGSPVDAGTPFVFGGGLVYIGCSIYEGEQLDGNIKQVAVYNASLTDAEVAAL